MAVDGLERAPAAADARELEQVVDELLHPPGAVGGELDVRLRAVVELPLVAPLEHLGEARHLAQRLLQVVRGDVGELLELGVRALQVGRLARQRRLRLAQGGDLGDDAGPHAVDVAPQFGHLARAGRVYLAGEVAARHAAHIRGQASERPDDDPAQRHGGGEHGDEQEQPRRPRTARAPRSPCGPAARARRRAGR